MAVSLSVVVAKDGGGTTITGGLQAQDKSGTGAGPFTLGHIMIDGLAGTNMAAVTAANAVKVDGSAVTQPVSLTSTTITGTVAATQSGTWTVQPGNTPNTTPWLAKISDGTNAAAIKAASTAPVGTDPALVVSLSPNSAGVIGTGTQASPSTAYISAVMAGDIAAAASDSGNPVKIGGVGKTANPTAVTDGQRVNAIYDKLGKQVVVGSVRDLKGKQLTTITSSTSETTVVTAVASTFLDVYGCIVENTSASACKVTFKDSTAGTTQFEFTVPAGDTRGFMLPESGAFTQTTVNNNWTATCGTSLASIVITMLYVKNI